jgi:hypothetical protein
MKCENRPGFGSPAVAIVVPLHSNTWFYTLVIRQSCYVFCVQCAYFVVSSKMTTLANDSVSKFISLGALDADTLAQLLIASFRMRGVSEESCKKHALTVCERTSKKLQETVTETSRTKIAKESSLSLLSIIGGDCFLTICGFLSLKSNCDLRFTCMIAHTSMMGYPISAPASQCHVIAPMRLFKDKSHYTTCSCQAAKLLSYVDLKKIELDHLLSEQVMVEARQTSSMHKLANSLGIGRAWSVESMDLQFTCEQPISTFIDSWNNVVRCKAYDYFKQLRMKISVFYCTLGPLLERTEIVENVEQLFIDTEPTMHHHAVVYDLSPNIHRFSRLTTLNIRGVESPDDEGLAHISPPALLFPQLSRLYLAQTNIINHTRTLSLCKELSMIVIETCPMDGEVSDLSSLSHLRIMQLIDSGGIGGDIASLSNLRNLEHIMITENHNVFGDVGKFLVQQSHLSGLILSNLTQLSGSLSFHKNNDLIKFVSVMQAPRIHIDLSSFQRHSFGETLTFFRLHDIPNACGDISCLSHLTALTVFLLSLCPLVGGDLSAFSSFTKMKNFTLSDCPLIHGDIFSLVSILPTMEKFILKNLPKVTGNVDEFSTKNGEHLNGLYIINCGSNIDGGVHIKRARR